MSSSSDTIDLLFVTSSDMKFNHVEKMVSRANISHLVRLKRIGLELPEIQGTEEEVAREKITSAIEKVRQLGTHKAIVMVEDTSLSFSAWGGSFPGPYIKHFLTSAGAKAVAESIPPGVNRQAVAISTFALGLVDPERTFISIFSTEVTGAIAARPRAAPGTSCDNWDCLFVPDGGDQTLAEMEPETYDNHLPRMRSARQLVETITSICSA